MLQSIEKKLKECEEFDNVCTEWIDDYEVQMKQMKYMKEQNSKMLTTCKEMLNKKKIKKPPNVARKLNFDTDKTPPTPTRIIPSQSQVTEFSQATEFSQSLLTQKEYETPKKIVHFKEDDTSDSDNDSILRKLLEDNSTNKSDKHNHEENLPKIQRKRQRVKK